MTKRTKTIALFSIVFTFLFCAIMGLLGLNFPTKVSAEYASPIPYGCYVEEYDLLELSEQTLTGSSAVTYQQAMGNTKGVKFKMTYDSKNAWNTYLGLFTSDQYYRGTGGNVSFQLHRDVDNNSGNIGFQIRNGGTSQVKVSVPCPSWLVKTAGSVYNVEAAAPTVYDANNNYKGTLFILEMNGVRLVEYFYTNTALTFTGGNFNFYADNTSLTISPFDQAASDLTGKATVVLTGANGYLGDAMPTVSQVVASIDGYGMFVEPKYYTVSYANTDNAGTATANVSFKGKYSGTATANFEIVDKFAGNKTLPNGFKLDDDYTVMDVNAVYGDINYTSAGSELSKELNGSSAIRFNLKINSFSSAGLTNIALFAKNSYSTDSNAGMINFYFQKNSQNNGGQMGFYVYQTNNLNKKAEPKFTQPAWLDFAASDYDFEVGGIDVYNYNNEYAGKFFYVDVDGVRIIEYFFSNSTLKFTCDKFNFNIYSNNAVISGYALNEQNAVNLTGKTKIEVLSSTKGNKVEINPAVYASLPMAGQYYLQLVESKYIDVAYVDNDKAGTATANITFKGKYAGTASIDYQIVNVALTSDTDQTINILALDGATVDLGKIDVAGRAFVGYDVDGVLKTTHSIVAEENATVKYITVDFSTLTKASIKATGTKGMRFSSSIDTNDVARLAAYGTLTFGARITSPTRAGHLDIETTKWVKQNVADEKDTYYSTITNFGDDDYNTAYMAQAYVDIAIDSQNTIRIYAYIESEYSRTIVEVAIDTIASGYLTPDDPTYDYIYSLATYNDAQ